MLTQPFVTELALSDTILLAGAGGGYDIYSALPLFFALRSAGKTVHLANLSFSPLYASTGRRMGEALVEVTDNTEGSARYFPEMHLARWLKQIGMPTPIYCLDRVGAAPIRNAYARLVRELGPDCVLLVDGGTDSLMRGDEVGLGTPEEDIASIAAVHALNIPRKLLACIGFGIDTFHGVCHAQFLEAVAGLIQEGGYLGTWSITREMPEARRYLEAVDYVSRKMINHPSIVSNSIASAVEGHFGNHHATFRTEGSDLFINPLMSLYWCFQLDAVARRNLYLDVITETSTYEELSLAIENWRIRRGSRKLWVDLPM